MSEFALSQIIESVIGYLIFADNLGILSSFLTIKE